MTTQQPEALRLADSYEATYLHGHLEVAAELRRQHARIVELEAKIAAAQPAAQGAATTGYIAPKSRYVPPVLFSPYTGEPRDARDIASDPRGILIVPPSAALAAQAKQGGK